MLGLDAFISNDQLADFEVVPRLKLDDGTREVTWEFDEVTETDGMHFIRHARQRQGQWNG